MFDEYKIKIKDDKIKIYTDGLTGKDFLMEFPANLLKSIKLSKELKKAILGKSVEIALKEAMKSGLTPQTDGVNI